MRRWPWPGGTSALISKQTCARRLCARPSCRRQRKLQAPPKGPLMTMRRHAARHCQFACLRASTPPPWSGAACTPSCPPQAPRPTRWTCSAGASLATWAKSSLTALRLSASTCSSSGGRRWVGGLWCLLVQAWAARPPSTSRTRTLTRWRCWCSSTRKATSTALGPWLRCRGSWPISAWLCSRPSGCATRRTRWRTTTRKAMARRTHSRLAACTAWWTAGRNPSFVGCSPAATLSDL
mmetsp:Transcript_6725/g.24898  ORF Transcript_6725/g.24898 Transcript_6725/m.24898 type:complete len:237 (+) Transcript_6725:394-1104(+)